MFRQKFTKAESEKQQSECKECQDEIAFQKQYLTALGKKVNELPVYDSVLRRMTLS